MLDAVPHPQMKSCFGHIGRPVSLEEDQKRLCHGCEDLERCHCLSSASALWEQTRTMRKGIKS